MNYADELKNLTVRVAEGSGVLMRFPSVSRTFVLTAWHCIKEVGDDITIIPNEETFKDAKITIIDKWEDEDRDVCIIEINSFSDDTADEIETVYRAVNTAAPERLVDLILDYAVVDGKSITFHLIGGLHFREVL